MWLSSFESRQVAFAARGKGVWNRLVGYGTLRLIFLF